MDVDAEVQLGGRVELGGGLESQVDGEEEEGAPSLSQSELSPSSSELTSLSFGSSSMLNTAEESSLSPPTEGSTKIAAVRLSPGSNKSSDEWHCDHPGCGRSFPKGHDLNHHKRYHIKPYECDSPSCEGRNTAFSLRKDLIRHQARHSDHRYYCPNSGCGYAVGGHSGGFTRKDNWRRHINTRHDGAYGLN